MRLTRMKMKASGAPWRRAFFESMKYDLLSPKETYLNLPDNASLKEVAKAIQSVGEHWGKKRYGPSSMSRSSGNGPLTRYRVRLPLFPPRKTNFDPVQLAFALRIHHDVEPESNTDLIRKGLEIALEAQQEDGTWPTGAPFLFDGETLAAVYVANLEIMNALLPLIDKFDLCGTANAQIACSTGWNVISAKFPPHRAGKLPAGPRIVSPKPVELMPG